MSPTICLSACTSENHRGHAHHSDPTPEKTAELQSSLFSPLLVHYCCCYRIIVDSSPEDYVSRISTKFEILHNPTKCSETDPNLRVSQSDRGVPCCFPIQWCRYRNSYGRVNEIHFCPDFKDMRCNCIVVLILDGWTITGTPFRETVFLKIEK